MKPKNSANTIFVVAYIPSKKSLLYMRK